VIRKATPQAPPTLFGQSQKENSPKLGVTISPPSALVGSCSASELRSLRLLHLDDESPPALCVRSEWREIPPRPLRYPCPLDRGEAYSSPGP
jgi:hypothetical protein